MQEEKNITTMLIVSLLLLWIALPTPPFTFLLSGFLGGLPIYHLPPSYTAIELAWYFINRLHTLTFILTITFATLYQANIGMKQLLYRLSVYLFIISMTSIFITFAQMLIGLPYR